MAEYNTLQVETDGPVATVTLNRPDKLNSISIELRDELVAVLQRFNPGDEIRVIRLRGAGRAFSAGYDLEGGYDVMSRQKRHPARTQDEVSRIGESFIAQDRDNLRQVANWLQQIRRFRKPLVAQVHGYCLAGGLDLIGVCDSVFAAEDACLGHPASRALGLPTTLGLLPIKAGPLKTKELLFTGDTVNGREAEQWQIVNRAVPADELDAYVMKYCRRIALLPLDMLTVHKEVVNRWVDNMGYGPSVDTTVDLNSISHQSPFTAEFLRIATTKSLKAALEWRDGPFRGSNAES
ncbi:enoyl-CoA hydratase-related protein [Alsobacter sp. SYSU M60028]|uniref:Enoyl-CoA hydratase-related protein n=1 Tax=Alsobacter ponti TaxID=2962936 RepID=A0ABT1LEQ8_9HYPH|nr:enoyl-CoA hydratase-related protein [Alsobacter ponti]MCP8939991.1 enoyl-CoA hydratase-related protein [Alsobacter ponti]